MDGLKPSTPWNQFFRRPCLARLAAYRHLNSYGFQLGQVIQIVAGHGLHQHTVGSGAALWMDAHGDLNRPETSPSGNVAGANPAAYTTSYSYDAQGRIIASTDRVSGLCIVISQVTPSDLGASRI